jgi:hypothetical protein
MGGGGQLDHRLAIGGRGQAPRRLVGGQGGRDEEHPVEGEKFHDLVGEQQVPVVDRVERASEDRRARHP